MMQRHEKTGLIKSLQDLSTSGFWENAMKFKDEILSAYQDKVFLPLNHPLYACLADPPEPVDAKPKPRTDGRRGLQALKKGTSSESFDESSRERLRTILSDAKTSAEMIKEIESLCNNAKGSIAGLGRFDREMVQQSFVVGYSLALLRKKWNEIQTPNDRIGFLRDLMRIRMHLDKGKSSLSMTILPSLIWPILAPLELDVLGDRWKTRARVDQEEIEDWIHELLEIPFGSLESHKHKVDRDRFLRELCELYRSGCPSS